ncbi:hypothetical protein EMPS_08444 [Entomortierella parvispora]|uniref:F-box domain-containing protein n=1 Tax=Entomortierella parvispora TaxID=205924 RepID=A0A9P3HGE0_9FUNG|nr:hypothetical protein EMPS_08444 [Entomortierella parvispora]
MREQTISDAFPPQLPGDNSYMFQAVYFAIMLPLVVYAIVEVMFSELRLRLSKLVANRMGSIQLWVKVVRTLLERLAAGDSVVVAVAVTFRTACSKRPTLPRLRLSPLELPEILFVVAPYIGLHGGRSICSSLRVCKTWHRSFIHLIWRDLELQGTQTPYRYILAKRGLIQSLVLRGNVPIRYAQLEYPHLSRLEVKANFGLIITELIHRHRKSLRHIRLRGMPHANDSHPFWSVLANLPRLQNLDMTNMVIMDNRKCLDLDVAFSTPWMELTLQNLSIYGHRPTAHLERTWHPNPPMLQKVVLRSILIKRLFADELASRLLRCSNLQSLEWDVTITDARHYCPLVPTEVDGNDQRALLWPCLTRLQLSVPNLADDKISAILMSLQRGLTELGLQLTAFGQLATNALIARHAQTLRDIDLEGCPTLTEAMEADIVTACPHLTAIRYDPDLLELHRAMMV